MQQIFTPEELLALARFDLQQNRVEQALEKVKTVLAQDASSVEAQRLGAKIYAQLGLLAHARELFSAYLEKNPNALEERFQLGMVHLDSGEEDQALAIWQNVLEQYPTFPPALFYCSVVLQNQKQFATAKRNLDVLLQTAAKDNLYFERAKELLHNIQQQASASTLISTPIAYQS